MPIKLVNGQTPLKQRYRMFVINQHNISPQPAIPDDYMAFYKFDNSKNDETGVYNLIEQTGGSPGVLTFENGRKGDALGSVRFNNTTTNARWLIKNFTRKTLNNGFTLSVWLKVISTVPNVNVPVQIDDNLNFTAITTRSVFSTPSNMARIASGGIHLNTISSADLGTSWRHHVLKVDSAGKADYYIDNTLIINQASLNKGVMTYFRFGSGVGSAPYNGNIDDFRLYERVLTTDEITALYNE